MAIDQFACRIRVEPLALLVDAGDLETLDALRADKKVRRRARILDLEMVVKILLATQLASPVPCIQIEEAARVGPFA